MKKRKVILISVICVIVLAIAAAVLILLLRQKQPPDEGNKTTESGQSTVIEDNRPIHQITFYSDTDTVLKIDSVREGDAAVPPILPQVSYGKIFKCWDRTFSDIKEDFAVHAETEDLAGKENVFALSGAYGKPGETAIMPLGLFGKVCTAGFELTIDYDPEKLTLESVFDEDGALLCNTDRAGSVIMNFVSKENTVGDVDLVKMKFRIKSSDKEIPVSVTVKSIYAYDNDESMTAPEYNVIDASVFVIG